MNKVEVCYTPAIFDSFKKSDAIVVVVDILRATSAICAAFINGVDQIIPVATIEEARKYKDSGYMVAAERDGIVLDFADFGNSPFNFTRERVACKTIVYSTTNGTQAVNMASECFKVAVGSYLNISALAQWATSFDKDIIIFCAGWKNRFSLEDSVFAGALAEKILKNTNYHTICDSALAAIDLWEKASPNLIQYIDKAAQRSRLRKNGLDDVIEYCHTADITNIIPVYNQGSISAVSVIQKVC